MNQRQFLHPKIRSSYVRAIFFLCVVLASLSCTIAAERSFKKGNLVSNRQPSKVKNIYNEFNFFNEDSKEHPNSVHKTTALEDISEAIMEISPILLQKEDEYVRDLAKMTSNVTKNIAAPFSDAIKGAVTMKDKVVVDIENVKDNVVGKIENVKDNVVGEIENINVGVSGWFTDWWTKLDEWFHRFLRILEAIGLFVIAIIAFKLYKQSTKIVKFFGGLFGSNKTIGPALAGVPNRDIADSRV